MGVFLILGTLALYIFLKTLVLEEVSRRRQASDGDLDITSNRDDSVTEALQRISQPGFKQSVEMQSLGSKMHQLLSPEVSSHLIDQGTFRNLNIPYYVYLRPFEHEKQLKISDQGGMLLESAASGRALQFGFKQYSIEDFLHRSFYGNGTCLALGDNRSLNEDNTIGYIESDDQNWKHYVSELLEQAKAIIMVPSHHPGTIWEIQQISNNQNWLDKTVWLRPDENNRKFRMWWKRTQNTLLSERVGLPFNDEVRAFVTGTSWAHLKTRKSPDEFFKIDRLNPWSFWNFIRLTAFRAGKIDSESAASSMWLGVCDSYGGALDERELITSETLEFWAQTTSQ